MTDDGLAGELPTGAILALCDKVLDEVGRRSHRFTWLRAPGAVADAWLPVEAYYPRHRLVVVCHAERTAYDHLFRQLVPEHGLRLLQFKPAELGGELAMAERVLRRMIARLPDPAWPDARAEEPRVRSPRSRPASAREREPAAQARERDRPAQARDRERPGPERPATARTGARAASRRRTSRFPSLSLGSLVTRRPRDPLESLRAARDQSLPGARVRAGRAGVATAGHAPEIVAIGVAAGLALALLCGIELILGVIAVTLDSGRVILGLGIALDACARILGALDCERAGETGWAWAWAIVGSPTVVAIALGARSSVAARSRVRQAGSGETGIEVAPLSILMATLALVCVVVGLLS
jgi:hypothetical protein